jgi:hypothetical protein
VWNWLNLFIGYHNKQLQIVKWTEPVIITSNYKSLSEQSPLLNKFLSLKALLTFLCILFDIWYSKFALHNLNLLVKEYQQRE